MIYYLAVKSKKSRLRYYAIEPLKLRVKFLLDAQLNSVERMLIYIKYLKRRDMNNTISYIHTRCLINFRARSVIRRFRMSRIQMKNYASMGRIYGVAKSS